MASRITAPKYHWMITLHVFLTTLLFAQAENIKFEHLGVEQGLSYHYVECLLQDSKGFMWFGTQDGLNKYDGYTFTIYRNDPGDSLSLSHNWIMALCEDHSGNIWVGTRRGGLCRYDRERDIFVRYTYDKQNPNSLSGNHVLSIFETDRQVLWIGCGHGLNRYNRETDDFTRSYPDDEQLQFENENTMTTSITQDSKGRLWIGTWNQGLFYFDEVRDKFVRYVPNSKYAKIFINRFANRMLVSRLNDRDYLWFGSYGNGLFKIDLENGEIKRYLHQPHHPTGIGGDKVWSMYQTGKETNNLWIGTEEGGLSKLDIQTGKFTNYRHQPEKPSGLKINFVTSIIKDKSGLMWLGTIDGVEKYNTEPFPFHTILQNPEIPDGMAGDFISAICETNEEKNRSILWFGTNYGLYRFDRTRGIFTRYKNDPEDINSLSDNFVLGIIQPKLRNGGILWVCTSNGLNKFSLKTKRVRRYHIPQNNPLDNQMHSICEDKNGIISIGTQSSTLYSFDPLTEQFTGYSSHPGAIFALLMDASGMLWLGTEAGLYKFNTVTRNETRYQHIGGDPKSISNNTIWQIFEDKKGALWIATSGGINKFNRSSETFTSFTEKDGLPSDLVRAILEDRRGNLWLSTNKGISKFNPNNKIFSNFNTTDGLHSDRFARRAYYMNHQGEMFFGGRNGLTYFHPDSIKANNYVPPIVLTDFQIFNKRIKPGQNSPLKNRFRK